MNKVYLIVFPAFYLEILESLEHERYKNKNGIEIKKFMKDLTHKY